MREQQARHSIVVREYHVLTPFLAGLRSTDPNIALSRLLALISLPLMMAVAYRQVSGQNEAPAFSVIHSTSTDVLIVAGT